MRRTLFIAGIVAVAALAAAGSAAAQFKPGPPTVLVVALDGRFTSPFASTGTFLASGIVTDTGAHRDFTAVTPRNGPPKSITITVTCTGKKGSFTFVVKVPATSGFVSPGVSASSAPGAARIVKATGAYAKLVGAKSTTDLSFTSNPHQFLPKGTPVPTLNALRVIDVFKAP